MSKFIDFLGDLIDFLGDLTAIVFILGVVLLLLGGPFMILWNWFICDILNSGFQHITFWQSCGITLLINLIFGFRISKNA